MKPVHARLLLRLYPPAWRARFGPEVQDLLEAEQGGPLVLADLVRAALVERVFNPSGLGARPMQTYPATVKLLVRKPIAMSLVALAVVVATVAIHGAAREPDEGAAAHIFQLLRVGQLPVLAVLAFGWRRYDWQAVITVLALQVAAIMIALLPIWILGL